MIILLFLDTHIINYPVQAVIIINLLACRFLYGGKTWTGCSCIILSGFSNLNRGQLFLCQSTVLSLFFSNILTNNLLLADDYQIETKEDAKIRCQL